MNRFALFLAFLGASLTLSEATYFLPLAAGKEALRGFIGAYVAKLAIIGAVMQGLHVGYRRGRRDEYEQIIEVLDVPEDVYRRHKALEIRAEEERAKRERDSREIWKKLFGETPYPDDVGASVIGLDDQIRTL